MVVSENIKGTTSFCCPRKSCGARFTPKWSPTVLDLPVWHRSSEVIAHHQDNVINSACTSVILVVDTCPSISKHLVGIHIHSNCVVLQLLHQRGFSFGDSAMIASDTDSRRHSFGVAGTASLRLTGPLAGLLCVNLLVFYYAHGCLRSASRTRASATIK